MTTVACILIVKSQQWDTCWWPDQSRIIARNKAGSADVAKLIKPYSCVIGSAADLGPVELQ